MTPLNVSIIFFIIDEMSQRLKVSMIPLWRCSLNVFVIVIVFVFVFVFVVVFFVGQVMFPHHSDQMSQKWKVSKIEGVLLMSSSLSLSIVFVFVFVFVVVFLLFRSCFLITLIKCLKGQKSRGLFFEGVLYIYLSLSLSLSFCSHVFSWPRSVLRGLGLVWKDGRLWIQHLNMF